MFENKGHKKMWLRYYQQFKALYMSSSFRKTTKSLPQLLTALLGFMFFLPVACSQRNSAFFNTSSLISIPGSEWNLSRGSKEVTFRTCTDLGSLISMNGSLVPSTSAQASSSNSHRLALLLSNKSVIFQWSISGQLNSVNLGNNISNNTWYTITLGYLLGALRLSISIASVKAYEVTVANSSLNPELLNVKLNGTLQIGDGFTGCIYQGPGVNFSSTGATYQGITWDTCPLSQLTGCIANDDRDDCYSNPCINGGSCMDGYRNYTCKCPPNFNGTQCENDLARLYGCLVRPCLNGGTCNDLQGPAAFNCSCPPGFNGLTCENRIDMCRLTPCAHGVCISANNSYICNCSQTGYKGQNCSENINECALNSTICGPNSTCFDYPGSYNCACLDGFDGKPCQNVDDCLSQPCQSSAVCKDGISSYTCTCASGYTGVYPNCTDINECNMQYCQHAANCTNSPGGYNCTCLMGYTGPNCSTNACDSNPCVNATNCTVTANGYTCSCQPGFTGKNCDTDIIDCLPGRCLNNAGCQELVNSHRCICPPGFTGLDCGQDINECESNPCQHGAQCNNLNNSFSCNCTAGYEGPTCDLVINMCSLYNFPCKNNGTCLNVVNDYFCNCTGEWMGKNCTEPYYACASQPCQNNGNCSAQKLSLAYSCVCASGFTGTDCSQNIDDCWNVTCPNNSVCFDGINSHKCDCPLGFTGPKCETEIDECEVQPCENGGKCSSGRGNKTCACVQSLINVTLPNGSLKSYTTGYTGKNCEIDIDECKNVEPICQNGGMCQNTPKGSFSCYCKTNVSGGEMYVGALCEQLRSYCDIRLSNQTCQHGGTCVNLQMSSKCECAPGFTGTFCEIDIDDCVSKPCGLNGICKDLVNNYTCSCIDGITGRNCEININDCDPDPCLNQGVCIDGINNYTCNCNNTGFNGSRCEYNIDDCASSPCQNGGNCTDGIKNYTCQCYKGYTGSNCHIDIQECTPNPCGYNSTCLEYSNKTLYDKGHPSFVNFTYERAAGYLCVCVPGVTGSNCSIDIDECVSSPCLYSSTCKDQFNGFSCVCSPGYQGPTCAEEIDECNVYKPCQHNGVCIDKIADYLCTCRPAEPLIPSYGGKNCSTLLTGCDRNGCKYGKCIPKLDFGSVPEKHGYDCLCNSGYTGTYCDITTSMSFVSPPNYVRINTTASMLELRLQFRTSLPSVLLLVLKLQGGNAYIAVQIDSGKLQLKVKDASSKVVTLDTLLLINDSAYHSLVLSVSGSLVTLSLLGDRCASDMPCNKSVSTDTPRNVTSLTIGSAAPLGILNEVFPADFFGCVEDLRVNKQLYYPGLSIGEFINVTAGCSRVDQCTPASCSKQGSCEDLWNKYICHCNRPYVGLNCEAENPAATFGVFPGSYVDYIIPSSALDNATISFFIVTRQRDGFIMLASNGYSSNSILSFLALYISNFQLAGDFQKCNFSLSFTSNRSVSDGQRHFLSVVVKDSNLIISCDSEKVYEKTKIPSTCRSGFGFKAEKLTFGKYLGTQSRSKREALMPVIFSEGNEVLVTRVKRQAPPNGLTNLSALPDLEGVIQDIQLNSEPLNFESDPQEKNVTIGAVSTRSACKDYLDGLCLNGGTCQDIFYNDYKCACLRGYTGKNCSELDFCSYGSCPSESTCFNLPGGYECVGNASFLNDDSSIQYTMNGSTPKPPLTFKFRTRGLYGLIFLLRYGEYFFKVRVAGGALEVNSKLSSEFSETTKTNAQRPVNDGKWYSASFDIVNGTHVELVVYSEGKAIDSTGPRLINSSSVNVSDVLSSGELVLGNTLRTKYSREWEANYRGCLREVRMGGVLMPFYTDDTFVNNSYPVKFLAKAITGIVHHCTGEDVCRKNFCLNSGECLDTWNHFTCKCPTGFYGDYCENNPDNCGAFACQNGGLCVDGLDDSTCMCPAGYTDDFCEDAVNLCANNSCSNNTPCINHGQDYMCNCSGTDFTGWYCNISIHQNCNQVTCQNQGSCSNVTSGTNSTVSFNCTCLPGYEGPLCEKAIDYCNKDGVKCANNGTCENHAEYQNYTCRCDNTTGFTGPNCTDEKDNCFLGACANGTCVNGVNNYTCNCISGYTGLKCDILVDACRNGSFCQHGICNPDTSCNCTASGWNGTGCVDEVDECKSNVCQHGANCTNLEGDYNCNCTEGYSGKNCDMPNCTDIHCRNNGSCTTNATDWNCECVKHIGGKYCDKIGPCFYGPCVHSSNCTQSSDFNNYTCACIAGWKGLNCSEDINECTETNPPWKHNCTNGTCVNFDGSYSCSCNPGYTGRFCETDIDECEPKPCLHGQCVNLINNYTCICDRTGFIGTNCSQDIDECSLNSTLCNQGKCVNKEPFYTCDCGEGYLGDHCQFVNPCANTTCLNGGTCQVKNETDWNYSSWCSCSGNYEGATCEKSPSTKDTDLGIIIGPIVGGIVFIIIIIVVIAFIMTARSKRATRGAYSPSQQETSGSRVELGNVLKKPPEERLI